MDLSQIIIKGQNWKVRSYIILSNFIKVVSSTSNYFFVDGLISNCQKKKNEFYIESEKMTNILNYLNSVIIRNK